MTPEEFLQTIRQNKFAPVYLIHGEEDFLIDEMVQDFISTAVDDSAKSFNLDIIYGNEVEAKDVIALASAYPMMSERRVVVVHDADKIGRFDQIESYVEKPSITTSLLLVADKVDMRRKPYTTLKTNAEVVESKPLYDNKIPEWIVARAEKVKKKISLESARLLQAYVGNSLRDLHNELEKLCIAFPQKNTIDTEDISSVVGISKAFNIFELTKSIGNRDIRHAVEIVDRMLTSGEQATMMIVMITRHFTTLWKLAELRSKNISERDMASAVGVHPFFLKEYLTQLSQYSVGRIERNYSALVHADEKIKTSGGDHKLIMTVLLHELMVD